jgi:hypothetical protein
MGGRVGHRGVEWGGGEPPPHEMVRARKGRVGRLREELRMQEIDELLACLEVGDKGYSNKGGGSALAHGRVVPQRELAHDRSLGQLG